MVAMHTVSPESGPNVSVQILLVFPPVVRAVPRAFYLVIRVKGRPQTLLHQLRSGSYHGRG